MTRLARASALQFAVNIAETVVGALATLYFVNVLGVGGFGRYALALALVNWLLIPAAGIRSASLKRVSEGVRPDAYFTGGLALQAGFTAVAVLLLLVSADLVNGYVGLRAAGLIAAFVTVKGAGQFVLDVHRGDGHVEESSLIEGGWNVFRSGTQAALVFAGVGVIGLLYGEIVAAAIAVAVTLFSLRRSIARPSTEVFRSLYEYGKYAWFNTFTTMSYSWMDTIVLGFFVAKSTVGAYEVAWRVTALFILLPTAVGKVTFPSISRRAATTDPSATEGTLRRALSLAAFLAFPGVVGAYVIGRPVLELYGMSGAEVAIAFPALVVLALGRVVESYQHLLIQALNALDHPDRTFRINAVFAVTNLGANALLVGVLGFGALGAALATGTTILLSLALAVRALPDGLRLDVSPRTIGVQVGSALGMGLLLLGIMRVTPVQSAVETVAYVGIGAGVYFLLVLGGSGEMRARLRQVWNEARG